MGFSMQKCWSGLPLPSPGDLPNPGIKPGSLTSNLHWQLGSLPLEPPRKLCKLGSHVLNGNSSLCSIAEWPQKVEPPTLYPRSTTLKLGCGGQWNRQRGREGWGALFCSSRTFGITVTLDNFKGKLTACWADNYREMDWKCQNTHVYSSLLPVFTKDCKKETSSGKNVPVLRRYWNERDSRMTLMSPHKVEREEHGGTEGRKEGWLESDIVMPLIFFHVANGSAWKQTAIFIVLLKQSCSQRNSGSTLKEPTTIKQLPSSPTHPNREEAM